jgi:hypothetical protein
VEAAAEALDATEALDAAGAPYMDDDDDDAAS